MSGMYPVNQQLTIFGRPTTWPGVDANGKFHNGSFVDPNTPASFVPAETLNLIIDNLNSLISEAGLIPNNLQPDQLVRALQIMLQTNGGGGGGGLSTLELDEDGYLGVFYGGGSPPLFSLDLDVNSNTFGELSLEINA